MDQGTAIGLQATAVGLGIGAVLAGGHARAMDAVRRDREARADAGHDAYMVTLLNAARRDLAKANREIARLKAEVTRLTFWNEILTAPKKAA